MSESMSETRLSTVLACGFSCIEQWALSGSLSKAHRLALVCGDSGQGSSLRPAQLSHSQSLIHSQLGLRLRKLAPEAAILPVVLNVSGQVPLGHVLPTGPLSPLLNIDLRAELRF